MRLDDEAVVMYREARAAHLAGNAELADAYHRELRKAHGIELYYEVDLPEHLMLVHAIGTVLGRATYADYFCAYQNVGVGSDLDGNRPVFNGPCVMFPGSKVLGGVTIGSNVFITSNTVISGHGVHIPDNRVVFPAVKSTEPLTIGGSLAVRFSAKPTKRSVLRDVFKVALA